MDSPRISRITLNTHQIRPIYIRYVQFTSNSQKIPDNPRFTRDYYTVRDLVLDVKGQNPKAQPSTFKIEALRIF